jgi:amidohydrolase
MTDDLKERVRTEIEAHAEEIIAFSQDVMLRPEPGYAEHATAKSVVEWLEKLKLPYRDELALTGVKAVLHGRPGGPTVGLLGELDAVLVPGHPLADPATDAAHACGHNAMLAAMLGAGLGLRTVMSELTGDVALFAVPAEEFTEVDRRLALRAEGKLEFPVGKAELLRLGEFDDIDLAMLVHTASEGGPRFSVSNTMNGAVIKRVRFTGRAAHAGGRPWAGLNAFKAATLAVQAIDAQRDTFPDGEAVRVNPVMTQVDAVPGVVPGNARLEVLIRGRTLDVLKQTCEKVDRALRAGAMALNTGLDIETLLAYLPLSPDPRLDDVVVANAAQVVGESGVARGGHRGGCTDMGDLGHVMPVSHPFASGAVGSAHATSYQVTDHRQAAVEPAVYLATSVIDLLTDDAAAARRIVSAYGPRRSLDDYLALRRSLDGHVSWEAEAW